ncbi:hypothetical protein ACG873_02235 [Mesorhizobium sp. AaZ16]|uniref:hypothetical protein n=1 Tax=Mesorhizobium sp. AaZ16 TaxID=3402289 RepID=UPI00374FC40C
MFDTIEIASSYMDAAETDTLRQKVNQTSNSTIAPGACRMASFKLDADFIGVRLAATAHDSLAADQFTGAPNEYARARRYLSNFASASTVSGRLDSEIPERWKPPNTL